MARFVFIGSLILVFAFGAFAQSGWSARRTGDARVDLVTVFFTSANRGFVAGDGGYLASTNDAGRTWTKYPLNTTEDINEIYFRNDENGYLVAGKLLFITRDGGQTWQPTQIFREADFPKGVPEFLSIRFADKKRGIIIGSVLNKAGDVIDSLVFRTENGGDSWQRINVPTKKELIHADFSGKSQVWAVGDDGVILHSEDGGLNWRTQSSGTTKPLYNVDFRNDNEGFAVGKSGTVLRTENGGATWSAVNTNFRDTFLRVNFSDDKNGWIVGYSGALLRSVDRGLTWIRQESGTTANLYGLYMEKKFGWAVGAGGTMIYYTR
ncbi:MAG: YCF48-related protein [Acidobacteriota bacterium]